MKRVLAMMVVMALVALLVSGSAEAGYIDPNTGGMIFQILAGAFALLSGLVLVFAGRIRMFFARMRRRSREQGATAPPDLTEDDSRNA